jgi:hypothetical protein
LEITEKGIGTASPFIDNRVWKNRMEVVGQTARSGREIIGYYGDYREFTDMANRPSAIDGNLLNRTTRAGNQDLLRRIQREKSKRRSLP